ncbi:MFS transporter [Streptomyces sp. NPDC002896]|uniref:MFS transporter n=1 Tax=Streptomyces sp. NPDC002896 TaxID=3154438 RepID=UPI003325AF1D
MDVQDSVTADAPQETSKEERTRVRRVATAAIVGTTVEWFDFYLYATMASIVFGKVFFPGGDSQTATLQSFATFAVGFIARPIGGIVFGRIGDRIGRKNMLVVTFTMMGVATTGIGLLPGYAQIGIWAPILLVVLRVVQGMGAGAEFAGAAVVSYEHARPGRRGSQGAWPALGLNIGVVLSSLSITLLTLNGDKFLLAGGWRIPFILSIVLVGVGVWIRQIVPETPAYEADKEKAQEVKFVDVLRTHWRAALVVFAIALGYSALTYIYKTFSVAYLTEFQGVGANASSTAVLIAALIAIVVIPFFGRLSDAISSKRVNIIGGALSIALAFPFLWLLKYGHTWAIILGVGLGAGVVSPMIFAAQGSLLSRQFPTEVRSTGVGTARELGAALAGAVVPLAALGLVTSSPTNSTVGVSVILVGLGVLVVIGGVFEQGRRHSTDKN